MLAVARVIYYLAPASELPKIVPPLLRLLHVSPEVERVVLTNLVITASALSVSYWVEPSGSYCSVSNFIRKCSQSHTPVFWYEQMILNKSRKTRSSCYVR